MPRHIRRKRPGRAANDEITLEDNAEHLVDKKVVVALTALNLVAIDAQIANLTEQKERLKEILKEHVSNEGETDGNGHKCLILPYGNVDITLQQQKRVTTNYVEDAINIINRTFPKDVAKLLVRSTPTLASKDVLLNLHEQGKITTRQLNSVLTDEVVNYAFQPVKIKPKQYE